MAPTRGDRTGNQPSQWIFLMPDGVLSNDSADICRLRHPKTKQPCMFLFSENRVYEITQCKENYRSWFVGDSVQQDGSLYMTTPMDALYLILPYLITAASENKFSPLEQIIHDDEFPESHRLCDLDVKLDSICDCKGSHDLAVYRYNEEKTLDWLKKKTDKVIECLKSENVHVEPGYVADTYVVSKKESTEHEHYVRYAYELISDYLENDLTDRLKKSLDIKELEDNRENKASERGEEPPKKKLKLEGPVEDYSGILKPVKQKQNLTPAQKKLEKIDKTGMKSITSFFSVKPKSKN